MINRHGFSFICMALISNYAFAADIIKVTVKTSEKKAAAIGFMVEKKQLGGLGKSYSGKGPRNKTYHFGFRKNSPFGDEVDCGTVTLSQDSVITLEIKDNKCNIILG